MNKKFKFNYKGSTVRVVLVGSDDEPYFVGMDVAVAIGYSRGGHSNGIPSMVIRKLVKRSNKMRVEVSPRNFQMAILYSGICDIADNSSYKKEADDFRHFVFVKVFPQLDKMSVRCKPVSYFVDLWPVERKESATMTDSINIFNFDGYDVRTVLINDEPYFVGKDVATVLGYSQTAKAIREHVPAKFKGVSILDTPGGRQDVTIISEAGLYKLIFKSHAKNAEKFTDWVASEVLPSIRKHGAYMTTEKAQDVMTGAGLADLLLQAGQKLKEANVTIEKMKPSASLGQAVSSADGSISVAQLAKLITKNGFAIGQNRLFKFLRSNGYLSIKEGRNHNSPIQKYVEQGLFDFNETVVNTNHGAIVRVTPLVTGKGQEYFINLFKSME